MKFIEVTMHHGEDKRLVNTGNITDIAKFGDDNSYIRFNCSDEENQSCIRVKESYSKISQMINDACGIIR